ncbi:MAG: pilus assembly protein TadE [Chloroflexus sp.]|jgi:Flp pilus assembly protein TadG|uniref:TadE family protein n=1 Tax=Chloroflexus aurantiacus (strain ATCC 29366 / DSM 635 / J-10-fl) TaxID=324602 RepID=A9WDG2_CHLAA|nr:MULTISPECIES: TadE family protein [Chloroflexus]ABY37081.1 TadE family protein [Chloroflexus aurantiacus J-10-fl]RMG46246.1 MAG: pilus assembly protein [Chloroflexota bacterium]GIV86667.1 MAG: pilus assembly protein TadE [Chloroflexus sp.]HBW66927.1 pilus assembly protein [Chloroflexus aurantiacus]
MMNTKRRRKTVGQAIVEFALSATVIFLLLAAAVDLGLIFFTLQALRAAAQEGATYGSYPVVVTNSSGQVTAVTLNYTEIFRRIRTAGGTQPMGVANLLDLNGDGVDDANQTAVFNASNPTNPNGFVIIENPKGANPANLSGTCATTTPRVDMRNAGQNCWIRVTIRYRYRLFFPFAPAFGQEIILRVTHTMPIRSQFVG